MQISNRIREIRKRLFNDSNTEFALFMGEKTATTSGWISGKRGVGKGVIDKIIQKIPEVDSSWLLTGEGEMLKRATASLINIGDNNKIGNKTTTIKGDNVRYNDTEESKNTYVVSLEEYSSLKVAYELSKKDIESLEKTIEHLNDKLEEKERLIQILMKK